MPRAATIALLLLAATTLVSGSALAADLDGDALRTLDELQTSTDPLAADTDRDGLADGREADIGTDPTTADTDRDGLADGREVDLGTDPTTADTDRDGLADAEEVAGRTDPTEADSDGDGLSDARELDGETNPVLADTDDDGLADGAELEIGADPLDPDTDGNGVADGREVAGGGDPTVRDGDGDTLSDATELRLGTDLGDADTDGDGLVDPVEAANPPELPGADPLSKDVYVEVDYMEGCSYREPVEKTVRAFASAPVENPDGTTGIDLHVDYDDEVPPADVVWWDTREGELNDFRDYRRAYFDDRFEGHHYVLLVETLRKHQVRWGYSSVNDNAVDCDMPGTFMHELGHSLGIGSNAAEGVDSTRVGFGEYPSAMNYNAPTGYYGYSNGTSGPEDYDDWGHIAESMGASAPSTADLHERYVNGSVDAGGDSVWNASSSLAERPDRNERP